MSPEPKPNPSGSLNPIDRAASILAKLALKKRKPIAEAAKDLEYTGNKKVEAEKNFDRKRKEVLEAFRKKNTGKKP